MTLYASAMGAVAPWRSVDAGFLATSAEPQEEIERCLSCERCAEDCEKCDGRGNLRRANGRPKIQIDLRALKEMMRLRATNKEMCRVLSVSEVTLRKAKKEMIKEIFA